MPCPSPELPEKHSMKQESYTGGLQGEQAAEEYLTAKGMTCLARRFRGGDGEVDLIMEDGETIVFVEVKARPKGKEGDGFTAVTPAKQRRITHAAGQYLLSAQCFGRMIRFDVVEITSRGINHVSNAFQPASWA